MQLKITVRNQHGVFDSDVQEVDESMVEQVKDLAKSSTLAYFALTCTKGDVKEDIIFRKALIDDSVISIRTWEGEEDATLFKRKGR